MFAVRNPSNFDTDKSTFFFKACTTWIVLVPNKEVYHLRDVLHKTVREVSNGGGGGDSLHAYMRACVSERLSFRIN